MRSLARLCCSTWVVLIGVQAPAIAQPATATAEEPQVVLDKEQVEKLSDEIARAVAGALQGKAAAQGKTVGSEQQKAGKAVSSSTSTAARVVTLRGSSAKTLFVDVGPAGRRGQAAKHLTELYEEQAKAGWSFADLELYIEDGDLQGFFVTFTR